MHGLGVAVNTKLAWEYFARANFGSRHARLSRAEGAMLRLAKGVYERAPWDSAEDFVSLDPVQPVPGDGGLMGAFKPFGFDEHSAITWEDFAKFCHHTFKQTASSAQNKPTVGGSVRFRHQTPRKVGRRPAG